jgi:hypothetical protein
MRKAIYVIFFFFFFFYGWRKFRLSHFSLGGLWFLRSSPEALHARKHDRPL